MSVFYAILAGLGLVLMLLGWVRLAGGFRRRDALDEPLPMAPLQRRAWLALAIGCGMTAAMATLFLFAGSPDALEDRAVRLPFIAILLVGTGAYFGALHLTRAPDGGLDERDRRILAEAPAVQSGAMLVCLAAWTVVLTEVYWDTQQVPLSLVSLMFWTTLVVHVVSLSAGILLGYRRAALDGQG